MKCDDHDCEKCKAFRESPKGKALADAYAKVIMGQVPQDVRSKAKRPRRKRRRRKTK